MLGAVITKAERHGLREFFPVLPEQPLHAILRCSDAFAPNEQCLCVHALTIIGFQIAAHLEHSRSITLLFPC